MVTADWKIGFKPAGARNSWYVVRTVGTAVDTVVNNWTNSTTDENFPVVNGDPVAAPELSARAAGQRRLRGHRGWQPDRARGRGSRHDLVRWAAVATPPATSAERFPLAARHPTWRSASPAGSPGQKAYRYVRKSPATGTVYEYQDYVRVPFTVFDTDTNQQLNAAFLESEATANGQWDPSDAGNGGREVIWVLGSLYSGNTADPFYELPANSDLLGATLDLRYEFYSRRLDPTAVIDAGDKVQFITSLPATPNDVYTFSTTAPNAFKPDAGEGRAGTGAGRAESLLRALDVRAEPLQSGAQVHAPAGALHDPAVQPGG